MPVPPVPAGTTYKKVRWISRLEARRKTLREIRNENNDNNENNGKDNGWRLVWEDKVRSTVPEPERPGKTAYCCWLVLWDNQFNQFSWASLGEAGYFPLSHSPNLALSSAPLSVRPIASYSSAQFWQRSSGQSKYLSAHCRIVRGESLDLSTSSTPHLSQTYFLTALPPPIIVSK